jgi:hypothetical protein
MHKIRTACVGENRTADLLAHESPCLDALELVLLRHKRRCPVGVIPTQAVHDSLDRLQRALMLCEVLLQDVQGTYGRHPRTKQDLVLECQDRGLVRLDDGKRA